MIKQNAGFKHKIDRAAVEELFKPCPACAAMPFLEVAIGRPDGCTCPEQGELLTRLYRLAVPDFDRLEKLDGYPVVNRETGDFLMLRWVRRDRRLSPNVMAGGAWMNSGFSSREQTEVTGKLEDFEVWLPAAMVLNVAPAITIVPEPLNHVPHSMETENGKVTKVTIGHAGSDGLSQPPAPEARTDSGHVHLAPDRLRELFRMQRLLNQRIGVNTDTMREEEKTRWLLNYTRAMQQEMAELTDSVPWKWWQKRITSHSARSYVVGLLFGDLSIHGENHAASIQSTNERWVKDVILPMMRAAGLPHHYSELVRSTEVNGYTYPDTRFYCVALNKCDLFDEVRRGLSNCFRVFEPKYMLAGIYDSDGSRIIRNRRSYEEVSTRLYSKNLDLLTGVAEFLKGFGIEGTMRTHNKEGVSVFEFCKQGSAIFDKVAGFLHPDKTAKRIAFGFDEQNARVEVVDMFHFLISMAQVLGMSADDLFEAYLKKNAVNFQRQESGYTQKDHGDSKHI